MEEIFVEINNGLFVHLIEVMKARESRVKPTKVLKTEKSCGNFVPRARQRRKTLQE